MIVNDTDRSLLSKWNSSDLTRKSAGEKTESKSFVAPWNPVYRCADVWTTTRRASRLISSQSIRSAEGSGGTASSPPAPPPRPSTRPSAREVSKPIDRVENSLQLDAHLRQMLLLPPRADRLDIRFNIIDEIPSPTRALSVKVILNDHQIKIIVGRRRLKVQMLDESSSHGNQSCLVTSRCNT